MKDIEFLYLTQADVQATGIDMRLAMEAVEDACLSYRVGQEARKRGHGRMLPLSGTG